MTEKDSEIYRKVRQPVFDAHDNAVNVLLIGGAESLRQVALIGNQFDELLLTADRIG